MPGDNTSKPGTSPQLNTDFGKIDNLSDLGFVRAYETVGKSLRGVQNALMLLSACSPFVSLLQQGEINLSRQVRGFERQ